MKTTRNPKALDPKPANPRIKKAKPQALNPKPLTRKPQTPNPKTLKPETLNPLTILCVYLNAALNKTEVKIVAHCNDVRRARKCKPMINNPPPFKGLNIRIFIIITINGAGFINQGSGLPWTHPLSGAFVRAAGEKSCCKSKTHRR